MSKDIVLSLSHTHKKIFFIFTQPCGFPNQNCFFFPSCTKGDVLKNVLASLFHAVTKLKGNGVCPYDLCTVLYIPCLLMLYIRFVCCLIFLCVCQPRITHCFSSPGFSQNENLYLSLEFFDVYPSLLSGISFSSRGVLMDQGFVG